MPKVWPEPPREEAEAGLRLLKKAVSAMGGTAVIDRVKTLVLSGKIRQQLPGGVLEATVTTTYAYPNRLRRDLLLRGGMTVSTVFTPTDAFVVGPFGTTDLSAAEKAQLETTAMRNPLSLLKTRGSPLFTVAAPAPKASGVETSDRLVVRIGDETTDLTLDSDGRIVEIAVETPPQDGKKPSGPFRIRFSDFREAGGLVYPFASEAVPAEGNVFTVRLDSVRVNTPVAPALFVRPVPGAPSPGVTPVTPVPKTS